MNNRNRAANSLFSSLPLSHIPPVQTSTSLSGPEQGSSGNWRRCPLDVASKFAAALGLRHDLCRWRMQSSSHGDHIDQGDQPSITELNPFSEIQDRQHIIKILKIVGFNLFNLLLKYLWRSHTKQMPHFFKIEMLPKVAEQSLFD